MNVLMRLPCTRPGWALAVALAILGPSGAADQSRPAGNERTAPTGIVHARGPSFADDRGVFLPQGATLFWGPWGYKFDRERLERHLDFLARRGVDFVRVLGQVGTPGKGPEDSWRDRPIDPRWSDRCDGGGDRPAGCGTYDDVIAGFTDLAYDRYGLRVEWTVFGGTGFTPTAESRMALMDRMLAMAKGREHKIIYFEVANEFYQNGFEGAAGLEELRRLGRYLQDRTPVLVALSAPQGSQCGMLQRLYAGGTGEVVTEHFTRSGAESGWAAVRGAWELQFCEGLPPLRSSNEPIGPFASVRAEGDPLRLAMSAAMTYLSGVGAYVLHTGPGVRGGGRADRARGRPADIWAVAGIDRILAGLSTVRRVLPPDLPSWSRHEARSDDPLLLRANGPGGVQAFTAVQGRRFVILALAVEGPLTIEARVPLDVRVVHPVTGAVLKSATLAASAVTTVSGPAAYIITGEQKS